MDLSEVIKTLGRSVDRNSPTILTSMGVAGLITTVVLAVKATSKAKDVLFQEANYRADEWSEQTGEHQNSYPIEFFTPKELVEITWRLYIPTTVAGATTIACMIGANHISMRRNAALVSLLSIARTAAQEYQAKVVEQFGEKKEEKVREAIAQDKLKDNPVDEKTVILTSKGQYLCFDAFSGRYFRSDIETITRAENKFNQRLLREDWLGINEFYYEIGLPPIEMGDEFGWIAERSLLDIKKYTKLGTNDEPCLVIDYYVTPHHI